jgi:CRISPR-associated protein Csc2
MTILSEIKSLFNPTFPRLAGGKYIHFIMLRHTQSFPVFQTDGVLNTVRTQAGINNVDKISRLVQFKRKQTTPERLTGRESLRSLNITSADKEADNYCEYNGENSCKQCPDCIIYGFAIGDSGSERSKVYSDSAFSLTPYDENSRRSFTFNAPFEGGTMSEAGQMRSAINQLDHILPEVTFPTVETLKDVTQEAFIYVLGNLLRTKRYGAQESRTGTVKNHLLGIVFCDGEIFSNLEFTQALYDALKDKLDSNISEIKTEAEQVINNLLERELVLKNKAIFGSKLKTLVSEVTEIYQNPQTLQATLNILSEQTKVYSQTYGANVGKATKKKTKKNP